MALISPAVHAYEEEPKVSTQPIGSPFFRHLAFDYNLDLKELVKLEKRGFGRAETVTLVLISSTTGKPVKEYAKRRLKTQITLRELAKEAGMDYTRLYEKAKYIKDVIEAKEDRNLPPPVFETPSPAPAKKKKGEPSPAAVPTAVPSPQTL